MEQSEFESLPLVIPNYMLDESGKAETSPTSYTSIQEFLFPYLTEIHVFWSICFFSISIYLITRFIVLPLLKHENQSTNAIIVTNTFDSKPSLYRKFFHIHEIENDIALKIFGGAILLGFCITFSEWQMDQGSTLRGALFGRYLCWPFFQNCKDIMFLYTLPYGYSQTLVYMLLFGGIFLAAFSLFTNRIILAHLVISILLIFKVYFTLTNYNFSGNFDYYHTTFTIIFLVFAYKRFFASLNLVFFYFLSTSTKIHESWTLGTYFTSLATGLPLFSDEMVPLATNGLIFLEMIGAWLLFSKNKFLQRSIFVFFIFFHLYSGILVGYRYPTTVLPPLLILFGTLYKPFTSIPLDLKSTIGWAWCLLLIFFQSISFIIDGDEKMTMEGNFYGLYMFESNHQCVTKVYSKDEVLFDEFTFSSRERCEPYAKWFITKNKFCTSESTNHQYKINIDHSINGGPFYRIVDEPDLCNLLFKPFSRNEWIQTTETAEVIGRPVENFYY